jgi:predicted transcriptional regulator
MEKKIVDRYIQARKYLKMTIEAVKKELDCSVSIVTGIELNRIEEPSFKYVRFLVSKGINLDYLLGKSDVMLASNVKSNNMESENTELRQTLEAERQEKEELANLVKNMEGTINYLMGELEKLKKMQRMTWASEPNAMAVGKCKTVRLSGIGRRVVVENYF